MHVYVHVLMRDEKEGRKKEASMVKQTRKSNMYFLCIFTVPLSHKIKIEGDHSFMVDSPVPSETQSPYYISPQAGPFISTSQASGTYTTMTTVFMWCQRACNCRQYCLSLLGFISAVCWSCDCHVIVMWCQSVNCRHYCFSLVGPHQYSTAQAAVVPWVYTCACIHT